jgi:hypothetical protein
MSDRPPEPKQVRDLLTDLLGKEVTVAPVDPPGGGPVPMTAVFVHDDLSLAGVIGFPLPLAATLAAAVGLVPPTGAQACVEDGELSPMLADNLREVCNILTSLFLQPGGPHVRLHKVYLTGADVPTDVCAHLGALGNRLDLDVGVTGYPGGTLSLVVPFHA